MPTKVDLVLDTNIFLYAYDKSSVFNSKCRSIFVDPTLNLFTTSKNIAECAAVMSKLKYSYEEIHMVISEILNEIPVLCHTSVSINYFLSFLKRYEPKGNRVFDVEIVSIMIAHNMQYLCTVNMSDFKDAKEIQSYTF